MYKNKANKKIIINKNEYTIFLSKDLNSITITLKDKFYNIFQSTFNFNSQYSINEIIKNILYKIEHNEIKINKLNNQIN